jgi:hypothetical protein
MSLPIFLSGGKKNHAAVRMHHVSRDSSIHLSCIRAAGRPHTCSQCAIAMHVNCTVRQFTSLVGIAFKLVCRRSNVSREDGASIANRKSSHVVRRINTESLLTSTAVLSLVEYLPTVFTKFCNLCPSIGLSFVAVADLRWGRGHSPHLLARPQFFFGVFSTTRNHARHGARHPDSLG